MKFKNWLETFNNRKAIQDIILNFLRDKLSIKENDIILNMELDQIDSDIVSELKQRGIFDQVNPRVFEGNPKIKDIINSL